MSLDWPRRIPTIADDVVELRPLEAHDVDAVLECASDPVSQRFTTVPSPYRRQDAVEFVDRASAQVWPGFVVAITEGDDDDLLGTCHLRVHDEDSDVVAIGYMVSPAARGRGIATRATRLLIDFAWSVGAHRVTIDAFATNAASRAVAVRCGMRQEGVLREAHLGNGGIRHDVVVYGLLRSDPAAASDDPSTGGGIR
ncbi:GNAT family N-acetyltransferase [Williamsia deligens]|uniref:GNAT family N-acetyltransferase n=1 Tax=Williamsia deligens TaxID=321325 RepID=A0ABW3G727_9NOCA|nr:GNAT family protein [Williamsia deligens]MCP2193242.1 ribosomal-protein-alanine N-acetyltransferase [Williamsia deligens]